VPGVLPLLALLSLSAEEVEKPLPIASPAGAAVPELGRPLFSVTGTVNPADVGLVVSAAARIGLGRGFELGIAGDHSLVPLLDAGSFAAGHVTARVRVNDRWIEQWERHVHTALTFDVSAATFGGRPAQDNGSGARYWTGLRNYNGEVGLAVSLDSTVAWFARGALLASVDTQPLPSGPLQGPPPTWTLGVSTVLEAGAGINLGRTHVTLGVRCMIHSRPEDERVTMLSFMGVALG
jgi:hypothetical protein